MFKRFVLILSLMAMVTAGAWGHASVANAAEGGQAADAGPLSFDKDLAIWTAVVFLVLLAVLWVFAWGPISRGLEKREKQIADQIADTQRSHEEAKQLLAEYEKKLAVAQDEVRAIFDQARRDADQLSREMLAKAKDQAAAERDRAIRQIDQAAAAAAQDLARRSASLAVDLAGRIIGTQLQPKDHTRLIEEAIAKFPVKVNGKK